MQGNHANTYCSDHHCKLGLVGKVLCLEFDPYAFMGISATDVSAMVSAMEESDIELLVKSMVSIVLYWNHFSKCSGTLPGMLYWFPIAAVIHYRKLNIKKQQKIIFLQL